MLKNSYRWFQVIVLAAIVAAGSVHAQNRPSIRIEEEGMDEADLEQVFDRLDPQRIPTGILQDAVGVLVDPQLFDGSRTSKRAGLETWRQVYHQFSRSGVGKQPEHARGGKKVEGLSDLESVTQAIDRYLKRGLVPIGVVNLSYDKIKPDAVARGLLRFEGGYLIDTGGRESPYETHRALVAAALNQKNHGRSVRFILPSELIFTRSRAYNSRYTIDFGDGRGRRSVRPNQVVSVTYPTDGDKEIAVTVQEGSVQSFAFTTLEVTSTAIPTPDVIWEGLTAERPYLNSRASYSMYAFLGQGNTSLTRPIVFVEGFDPYYNDPLLRRTWQEIYEMLQREDLGNRLQAAGYDLVILKLANATDYVQRNAFALEDLLHRLNALLPPGEQICVVGPSMGGVIGRFALAFMERNGFKHNVRLFASLDAPHEGANIPLGDQFLFEFFKKDSEKAQQGVNAVNSIAARQMLVYQYTTFPTTDPLRTTFQNDLDAYGYPVLSRNIAIASGSGTGKAQRGISREMLPGDQIIEYRYRSFFIDLDGNVWAVPDGNTQTMIFQGRKDVFGPHYRAQTIYVQNTLPYDNSPGGLRGTQGEIAGGDIQYGDIVTRFPDHNWIPTVSSLGLKTNNLFYNISTDPEGLTSGYGAGKNSTGSYDAIFYPVENQDHVEATTENVDFLLGEIDVAFKTSRVIAGDRVFNSGQVVQVADNVGITFEGTVTLAPGVRFLLGSRAQVNFKGPVQALGTSVAPIHFERSSASSWGYLTLFQDGNRFEHVTFSGGDKQVEILSKGNTFKNCTFTNGIRGLSSGYALSGGRSSFVLENSTVINNQTVGVVAYHAEAEFRNVTVRDNGEAGVWLYDAPVPLFYKSIVTGNAKLRTTRSGIEVLSGSNVAFTGPDSGPGYTRIANNVYHELQVSGSTSGTLLGRLVSGERFGGDNSVFDQNEGSSGATEMLVRNLTGTVVDADFIYWGGITPDGDDLYGPVDAGFILRSDPTTGSGAQSTPLLAGRTVTDTEPILLASTGTMDAVTTGTGSIEVVTASVSQPGDRKESLRSRMAELRRLLSASSEPTLETGALLRELFDLQFLDLKDKLGEKRANKAVIGKWREKLPQKTRPATSRGNPPLPQKVAEQALLYEIRVAMLDERYREAETLLASYGGSVEGTAARLDLLLEQVSLLEFKGQYREALRTLQQFKQEAVSLGEEVAAFDLAEEMLVEKINVSSERRSLAESPATEEIHSPELAAAGESTSVSTGMGSPHPNPFNPMTVVPFTLEKPAAVSIEVFDLLGRRVAVLADASFQAGSHRAVFDAAHLPSGLYLITARITPEGGEMLSFTRKVMLVK